MNNSACFYTTYFTPLLAWDCEYTLYLLKLVARTGQSRSPSGRGHAQLQCNPDYICAMPDTESNTNEIQQFVLPSNLVYLTWGLRPHGLPSTLLQSHYAHT
jgi:hypothetical protein